MITLKKRESDYDYFKSGRICELQIPSCRGVLLRSLDSSKRRKVERGINRLYYACFYAVIALLIKNNISTQTHDGARTQFGLIFVKTGIIDKE